MKKGVLWRNKKNWCQFLKDDVVTGDWWTNNRSRHINHALKRQAESAELILRAWEKKCGGIILADDVGLGKTWVAILVAIAAASAEAKVVISVPNQVMRNKWAEEFERWYGDNPHPEMWERTKRGPHAENWTKRHPGEEIEWVRLGIDGTHLMPKRILLTTHKEFANRESRWNCDILIVDEAHHGKDNLKALPGRHNAEFTLLMTATPFGMRPQKLRYMLEAVGCHDKDLFKDITDYTKARDKNVAQDPDELKRCWSNINEKLQPWIIRHSMESLSKREQRMLGKPSIHVVGNFASKVLDIKDSGDNNSDPVFKDPIPVDDTQTRQLILHTERLTILKRQDGAHKSLVKTLVAPYARRAIQKWIENETSDKAQAVFHQEQIRKILKEDRYGPMEKRLLEFAKECFRRGEKFIVSCAYHETRKAVIDVLRRAAKEVGCFNSEYIAGPLSVYQKGIQKRRTDDSNANTFDKLPIKKLGLSCGHKLNQNEWNELFQNLERHQRTLKQLQLKEDGNKLGTVPAVTDLQGTKAWFYRILFNSPFHPQALVITPKDSEGIDLHRYCRVMVHYELPYRPEVILQANGRIRRLESKAASEDIPPIYFYPYLEGTRSEQLTEVVVDRVEQFRKLMGGVPRLALDHNKSYDKLKKPDFSNKQFRKTL